jgi:hypothetical protein
MFLILLFMFLDLATHIYVWLMDFIEYAEIMILECICTSQTKASCSQNTAVASHCPAISCYASHERPIGQLLNTAYISTTS